MARGGGLLVPGRVGHRGHFEVVICRVGGGFWQFWRGDETPPFPWHGPGLGVGSEDGVTDVARVQGGLFPPQLLPVRREARLLLHSIRTNVTVHGVIRPRWGASEELPGGGVAGGGPG